METIEGFANFVYFINFWTKKQAQSQVCKNAEWTTNVTNGHYMLALLSTKQMVSNKCHKRERQVNQNHASGSDNFINGAEEVYTAACISAEEVYTAACISAIFLMHLSCC